MDAPLVRAYLEALPDIAPDEKSLARVRAGLASLQMPDVRYLVARMIGSEAPVVARVMAAVLRAAGATTGTLAPARRGSVAAGLAGVLVDGSAIDEPLLARAGTFAATVGYELAGSDPPLGELTRYEGVVLVGLIALAEASQRVVLLVDEAVDPNDAIHAPRPDLVVIGRVDAGTADRALELVPEGCPVVIAPGMREIFGKRLDKLGVPALVGDRDFRVEPRGGEVEFIVRDEPYVRVPGVSEIDLSDLATGLAAALALGALGIRMREDWVVAGIGALRGAPVGT